MPLRAEAAAHPAGCAAGQPAHANVHEAEHRRRANINQLNSAFDLKRRHFDPLVFEAEARRGRHDSPTCRRRRVPCRFLIKQAPSNYSRFSSICSVTVPNSAAADVSISSATPSAKPSAIVRSAKAQPLARAATDRLTASPLDSDGRGFAGACLMAQLDRAGHDGV